MAFAFANPRVCFSVKVQICLHRATERSDNVKILWLLKNGFKIGFSTWSWWFRKAQWQPQVLFSFPSSVTPISSIVIPFTFLSFANKQTIFRKTKLKELLMARHFPQRALSWVFLPKWLYFKSGFNCLVLFAKVSVD